MSEQQRQASGCDGGFFSAGSLRGTTYQGDDSPRLWTGASERTERSIDPSTLNRRPSARAPIVGYLGSLRVEVPADRKAAVRDVTDIKMAGAPTFNPNERVTVSFENASIEFFLKQLMGGALGVNYIAPPNLGGSITFRTEQPIPKGLVLQVVRDVLGRNNLEMAFMNGVYQIATPEEMAALRATVAAGGESDQVTRIVRLRSSDANETIAFVQQLVPRNVTMTAAKNGSAIIVRAAPSEINRISELISVSEKGVSNERVAIIPLRESSPEKITLKLNEFYRSQLGEESGVTVMPLENQQAILVGAKDGRVMEGLKKLVLQLDRDTGSDFSLRIITLTYLGADEIVPQLNQIFSGGDASKVATDANADDASDSINNALGGGGRGSFEDGGFSRTGNSGNRNASAGQQGAGREAAGGIRSGNGRRNTNKSDMPSVKIVADNRNNTVMVYSSYSLFKRVRQLLKTLDVPQAQVVIEATVAEVTLNDRLERGVEAYLTSNNILGSERSFLPLDGASPNLNAESTRGGAIIQGRFGVGGSTVDIVLKALQEVTRVKVVSSPYLTVRDNKTARLVIGDQIPFKRSTQTGNPDTGNATVVEQIEVKDTGVILEVTPRIRPDNSTILAINQSVSTVKEETINDSNTPTINTRQVNSEVIAKSGATILLGGLIRESVNKTEGGVPVLKDIAVVGELFKTTEDVGRREELIVLITPRVIRSSEQIENITRQLRGLMHVR